jgi:hypothetical protein
MHYIQIVTTIDSELCKYLDDILSFVWHIFDYEYHTQIRVRVIVFNDTLNNISVISLQSVLLVKEIGVPIKYVFILK